MMREISGKRNRKHFSAYSWELTLLGFLVCAVVAASVLSPLYLDLFQILYSIQQSMVITGILAIGLMLVVLIGEIDISLPAILAVGSVSFARLSESGFPIFVSIIIVTAFTTLAGLLNGYLIVKFSLPSMAVTLGMNGVYRALALLIGGIQGFSASTFGDRYIWLGSASVAEILPVSLLLLFLLFFAAYLLVHRSTYGKLLYATGNNRKATYMSGHNVNNIIVRAYGIAGFLAGIAALVYIGQYQSARADNVSNLMLFVVACVALGGFSLSGGKGNVAGLLLSILLLGTIQNGMGLINVKGTVQTLVIGLILMLSILLPIIIKKIMQLRRNMVHLADQKFASGNIS